MNQPRSFDADGLVQSGRPVKITPEDEREFQAALEDYKRRSGRSFPTWSEILEVLGSLGYQKRIWRPVEFAPASSGADFGFTPVNLSPSRASDGMLGWFSRVETFTEV